MTVSKPSRAPTPVIYQTCTKSNEPLKNSLATIRTCHCSKFIISGHVHVSGRMSPSNDEVRFYYRGSKYKAFVSGKGLYHLVTNDQGQLKLVRENQVPEFPCCDFDIRNSKAFV
jgi:hypothetical protein